MITKIRNLCLASAVTLITTNIWAINLAEVYQQALASDPTFKSARAEWMAQKTNLAIQRAAVLPQLAGSGFFSRNKQEVTSSTPSGSASGYYNSNGQTLTLTQSVFDFGKWANIWQAQAQAKAAEVTFFAAAENLIKRTANAYFDVLQANDILSYAKANREFLSRTLNQTKHQYDVGLIAIVPFDNSQAYHDDAIAKEIAAQNDVSINLEKLSEITGIVYLSLDPVKETFPLLMPQPNDIESWASAAERQNFSLAAKKYQTIMAREAVKIANAGHLPTLDAQGQYSYSNTINNAGVSFDDNIRTKTATTSATLNLNVPIFQGGQVAAQAKQANYYYQKAISDQEIMHRSVLSGTRQAYLNIVSYISQVKANKQAVKSAMSSIRATNAGYEAGTYTMVDVLEQQKNLYERQRDYAISEYTYIKSFLALQEFAGILDEQDILQVNSWLERQKLTTPETNRPTENNAKTVQKKIKHQTKHKASHKTKNTTTKTNITTTTDTFTNATTNTTTNVVKVSANTVTTKPKATDVNTTPQTKITEIVTVNATTTNTAPIAANMVTPIVSAATVKTAPIAVNVATPNAPVAAVTTTDAVAIKK